MTTPTGWTRAARGLGRDPGLAVGDQGRGQELHGRHGHRVAALQEAAWATTNAAAIPSEARTRPSPDRVAPPPPPTATRATPANDTPNPVQAAGGPSRRSRAAAITATSTGVAPMSRTAWLTLVLVMPAFWTRIAPP